MKDDNGNMISESINTGANHKFIKKKRRYVLKLYDTITIEKMRIVEIYYNRKIQESL